MNKGDKTKLMILLGLLLVGAVAYKMMGDSSCGCGIAGCKGDKCNGSGCKECL